MQEGLRQTTLYQSSKTSTVDETLNQLFDDRRPSDLLQRGVSRVSNIYAYLSLDEKIYDITNGEAITLEQLCQRSQQAILRLEVDETECYVSDLDLFDQIKAAYIDGVDVEGLIDAYWRSLVNLNEFEPGAIDRPEAMIVSDVPPSHITIIQRE